MRRRSLLRQIETQPQRALSCFFVTFREPDALGLKLYEGYGTAVQPGLCRLTWANWPGAPNVHSGERDVHPLVPMRIQRRFCRIQLRTPFDEEVLSHA
jgi:hypothetical protein